jgi:RNA polymerase sigma factor (sigma-70 family)
MKKKLERRRVTNEDFNKALANTNNIRLIKDVTNHYAQQIPADDLYRCGLNALWRCLSYHQDIYNQKFTTSLYRFVNWECRRELKKIKRERQRTINISSIETKDTFAIPATESTDEVKHLYECIEMLPSQHKVLIQEYFIEKRTMQEIGKLHNYSKEAARQKIKKAVDALKKRMLGV